eukprot:2966298-Alexandrium_andersonii.AAC.1
MPRPASQQRAASERSACFAGLTGSRQVEQDGVVFAARPSFPLALTGSELSEKGRPPKTNEAMVPGNRVGSVV